MPERAPTARPKRARKPSKKKPSPQMTADDIWRRTRLLVEVLLQVMEQGIRDPNGKSEEWDRLFGSKDSAVVTLQKLVQLLAELQQQSAMEPEADASLVEPVSAEEMALLKQWLEPAPGG